MPKMPVNRLMICLSGLALMTAGCTTPSDADASARDGLPPVEQVMPDAPWDGSAGILALKVEAPRDTDCTLNVSWLATGDAPGRDAFYGFIIDEGNVFGIALGEQRTSLRVGGERLLTSEPDDRGGSVSTTWDAGPDGNVALEFLVTDGLEDANYTLACQGPVMVQEFVAKDVVLLASQDAGTHVAAGAPGSVPGRFGGEMLHDVAGDLEAEDGLAFLVYGEGRVDARMTGPDAQWTSRTDSEQMGWSMRAGAGRYNIAVESAAVDNFFVAGIADLQRLGNSTAGLAAGSIQS